MSQSKLLPRLIHFRDTPSYLGMNRHLFNQGVRTYVTVIPVGIQGIVFDRLDLDAGHSNNERKDGFNIYRLFKTIGFK